MWWEGFLVAISGTNLMFLAIGTLWGLLIGALPGLGPMFAVSLALPLTYGMPAASAIIMLSAIHAATAYGDSMASILINTPGGVGSVASCWDGYPMAQQGKAGMALGISTAGSFLGGLIGWLSLVAISPLLIEVALRMGPPEYFMVALLALSLLSLASQGETIKGIILGGFGLLLAFIGRDAITGSLRFDMGSLFLADGIPLAPVALGLFALPQAIVLAEKGGSVADVLTMKGSVISGVIEAVRRPFTVIRSGIVGILLGLMPALGISSANIVAYLIEKKSSRHPETFGRGEPAGLLAPEVSKNSCLVGDLIPTFTLGIPGSGVTALFMAALILHGIQPGVEFFSKGSLPYAVFVGILLAQFSFLILGVFFSNYMAKIVLIPNALLVPGVIMLCFVGSYVTRGTLTDVLVMLVVGMLGYFLNKHNWPLPCLVLGFVLGDILESNFHRSLLMTFGSYSVFVTRPGALALLIVIVLTLAWPYITKYVFKREKGFVPGD